MFFLGYVILPSFCGQIFVTFKFLGPFYCALHKSLNHPRFRPNVASKKNGQTYGCSVEGCAAWGSCNWCRLALLLLRLTLLFLAEHLTRTDYQLCFFILKFNMQRRSEYRKSEYWRHLNIRLVSAWYSDALTVRMPDQNQNIILD